MTKSLATAQRGYGGRWQKARLGHLQANPLCVMCKAAGRVVLATVVDHIKPHRLGQAIESGDGALIAASRRLFWDRANWQSLCADHHDRDKQRLERSGRIAGAEIDGRPLDPGHHWNR